MVLNKLKEELYNAIDAKKKLVDKIEELYAMVKQNDKQVQMLDSEIQTIRECIKLISEKADGSK